jgi:hypothetical protein
MVLWLRRGLIVGAVVATVWILFFNGARAADGVLDGIRTTLYPLLASISGTLLALVFAAQTVLLGLASSERLAVVTKSGRYADLTKVFAEAVRSLGIATIAAVLALLFDRDTSPSPIWVCVVLNAEVWVVADVIRCLFVFDKVRLLVVSPSKARSGGKA